MIDNIIKTYFGMIEINVVTNYVLGGKQTLTKHTLN